MTGPPETERRERAGRPRSPVEEKASTAKKVVGKIGMSNNASADRAVEGQKPAASYVFANKIGRIFLLALEETAGDESLRAILSAAKMQDRLGNYPPNNFATEFSFVELSQVLRAVEELYGVRTGRALARRTGRACFRIGVKDLRPLLGMADVLFRILPLQMRSRLGFQVLTQVFDRFSDQTVRLEEDERYFKWITERCGVCWERHTDTPCCELVVGLLEEGLYWLSGGADFFIEESTCIAAGDPVCTILIGKEPLVPSAAPEA